MMLMKSWSLVLISSLSLMALTSLSGCGRPDDQSGLAAASTDASAPKSFFRAEGASNTSGVGLQFGIQDRFNYEFPRANPSINPGKKILLVADYFFPTNFPEFSDKKISDDQRVALVNKKLAALLATTDQMILADLFDSSELDSQKQNDLVSQGETSPLTVIAGALQHTGGTTNTLKAVNGAIRAFAKANSTKVTYLNFNERMEQMVSEGSKNELFQADLIHVNYRGQARMINLFAIQGMKLALKRSDIKDISENVSDEAGMIRAVLGLKASMSKKDGVMTGSSKLMNVNAIISKSGMVSGQKNKGAEVIAGDMKLVDGAINKTIAKYGASFPLPVELRTANGKSTLTLDLTNALQFDKITLTEDTQVPNKFYGFGSDYWGGSISVWRFGNPALTNYYFTVTLSTDKKSMNVHWIVLPKLQLNGVDQDIPGKRLPDTTALPAMWLNELKNNYADYNRLEYDMEFQANWN